MYNIRTQLDRLSDLVRHFIAWLNRYADVVVCDDPRDTRQLLHNGMIVLADCTPVGRNQQFVVLVHLPKKRFLTKNSVCDLPLVIPHQSLIRDSGNAWIVTVYGTPADRLCETLQAHISNTHFADERRQYHWHNRNSRRPIA